MHDNTSSHTAHFVILGTQRTGTTLIRTSLGSHPEVLCHGEVFNLGKKPYRDEGGFWHYSRMSLGNRLRSVCRPRYATERFLADLYSSPGYSAIGFKLMLSHCRPRPYIWPCVKKRRVKAILVERRNVLKTLVSRRTASRSGVYHVSETFRRGSSVSSWTPRKIAIDTRGLVRDLDSIEAENREWKARIGGDLDCLSVVYEQYVADVAAGNNAILDFLGVRTAALSSDLQKVNPDRLDQIIANYDEVAEALKNTRHVAHLEPA